jgi:ribonuclease P protein component
MLGYPATASEADFPPDYAGKAAGMSECLSKAQRLTKSPFFQETYKQGRSCVGRYMVLWLRKGPDASWRLGVVASRKVGGAVARSRAKRRLREAFRRHRSRFVGPYDAVLVARRSILSASWSDVVRDLLKVADKAGVLVEDQRE